MRSESLLKRVTAGLRLRQLTDNKDEVNPRIPGEILKRLPSLSQAGKAGPALNFAAQVISQKDERF
jgi:hypothetical protein